MSRYVRWALWAVVLGSVVFIAWSNREALIRSVTLVPQAHPLWLLLAVGCIGLLYLCRAIVYGIPLRLLDYTVPWTFLWQAAIIASVVTQLIPSGGASAYAFLAYALHRRGVSTGQASLIAIIDTLSYACAAATLVIGALLYLGLIGGLPGKVLLVGFAPGALLAALGGGLYWLQRERQRFVPLVLGLARRVGSVLGRNGTEAPVRAFLEDYYAGKKIITRRPAVFARMVGLQYLAVLADAGALYLTLASLGVLLEPAVVFLGFIVTLAAGAIVSAPAGGGSYEVVMSAFFAHQGLTMPQAIAGALLFRVVSFWIPVFISGLLFLNLRQRTRDIRRRRPAGLKA